jgi:hypothetical protein
MTFLWHDQLHQSSAQITNLQRHRQQNMSIVSFGSSYDLLLLGVHQENGRDVRGKVGFG